MNKKSLTSEIKKTLSHFSSFRYESIIIGSQVDDPAPEDPVVVELSYRGTNSIDPRLFDKIEGEPPRGIINRNITAIIAP